MTTPGRLWTAVHTGPHKANCRCGRVEWRSVHTVSESRGFLACGRVDRVDSLKGVRRRPHAARRLPLGAAPWPG
jgi:hypothetical protein